MDMKILIDGQSVKKHFRPQDWSTCEVDVDAVTVPNNNSIILKNDPYDGSDYDLKPYIRGGAVTYDVDISQVDCGCVAGVYAVRTSEECGEAENRDTPQCASIDIMQANHAGFNTAAHPCANGECDAMSQCQYNMTVEGRAKYGDDAYGRDGSLIDTNQPFSVESAFISTRDYQTLWKMRTTLTQNGREIMMEAECQDYLPDMSVTIEGKMGLAVSTWDNRDGRIDVGECKGTCPTPSDSCDNSSWTLENFHIKQWGFTEDIPEEEESEEESEDEDNSAVSHQLIGNVDGDDIMFYVKGLDGQRLETEGFAMTMGENNRAFVRDMDFHDDANWAYWGDYLGGSVSYDVNVADVPCGCIAGVYLSYLDNDECSWNPQPGNTTPQCATIDIMEANINGFNSAPHPCEFGSCDTQSQCQRKFKDDCGDDCYGHNSNYKINASESYSVKTNFWATVDENGDPTDLVSVETVLTQGENTVTIEQDCPEYLEPLAIELKNNMMAMSVSTYFAGSHNEVSHTCLDTDGTCDSNLTVENLVWTSGDSIVESTAEEIIGGTSMYLSDCDEGCSECHDAWMSDNESDVYQVCTDWTVYRFGNVCNLDRHDISRCAGATSEEYCLWSYDFSDSRKFRSDTKACRTLPLSYFNSDNADFKFSKKAQKNNNKGTCRFTEDCSTCKFSWRQDDEQRWKGATNMARCEM